MKSFDEFLNTLSDDDYAEIANKASKAAEEIRSDTEDPEYKLGNQVGVASMVQSIGLLRKYHDWLSQQFD